MIGSRDRAEASAPSRAGTSSTAIRRIGRGSTWSRCKCAKCGGTASRIARRRQSLARRRHRAVLDDGLQHAIARILGEVVPGRLHHRVLSGPVPQLVLRDPGDEHDDGAERRAVQGAAGARPGARSVGRRDAQVEGQLHPLRRRRRRHEPSRTVLKMDTIEHELKSGEQAVVPGALEVEVTRDQNAQAESGDRLCPPMGADLMRWLYCRQNPGAEHQFRPRPAEELRSKFILKLWNTYAFFCNYARLDGFDPAAPQVPVQGAARHRPLDPVRPATAGQQGPRGVSELQRQAFCLEAEKFVDDKLSNWYVRRNRRRFWKSEEGSDKLAAYPDALHGADDADEAVRADHAVPDARRCIGTCACRRPIDQRSPVRLSRPTDEALIDADTVARHGRPARLVTLGSAARNASRSRCGSRWPK